MPAVSAVGAWAGEWCSLSQRQDRGSGGDPRSGPVATSLGVSVSFIN